MLFSQVFVVYFAKLIVDCGTRAIAC